jgi:hypothetical protein
MARLLLTDDAGGALAAIGAALAIIEGTPGYDEVLALSQSEPLPVATRELVAQILGEVGVHLVPRIDPASAITPAPGDTLVSLGSRPVEGAQAHWDLALADPAAPGLVQRSTARIMRDRMARHLARFCTRLP